MQRRSVRNTGPATPAAEQSGQHPGGAGLLVRNCTNAGFPDCSSQPRARAPEKPRRGLLQPGKRGY
jgi:hypothetical protein